MTSEHSQRRRRRDASASFNDAVIRPQETSSTSPAQIPPEQTPAPQQQEPQQAPQPDADAGLSPEHQQRRRARRAESTPLTAQPGPQTPPQQPGQPAPQTQPPHQGQPYPPQAQPAPHHPQPGPHQPQQAPHQPPHQQPGPPRDHAAPSLADTAVRGRRRSSRAERSTGRRKFPVAGAVAAGTVLAIALGAGLWAWPFGGDEASEPASEQENWIASAPALNPAETSLTDAHAEELWTHRLSTEDPAYWFAAGTVVIDGEEGEVVLLDTETGDEIVRIPVEGEVQHVVEFLHEDTPAAGVFTQDQFVAVTAEGDDQSWDLEEGEVVRAPGTTPMLTTEEGDTSALIIGEEDPVETEGNPSYISGAIDEDTLIQVIPGEPRVALLPVAADEDSQPASEELLQAPTDGASFLRHLSVGTGHSLSLWEVDGEEYLVVHSLEEEPGTVTSAVAAPDEPEAWQVGRGMQLAVTGPYAFSLETGELTARHPDATFTGALGPAALAESEGSRSFVVDGTQHYESDRVTGYSEDRIALIRRPDGTLAALSGD